MAKLWKQSHNCENKGTTAKTKAQLQKIFLLFTLHCLLRLLNSAHSIPQSPPRSTLHACSSHQQQLSNYTIHHATMKHWVAPWRDRSTSMVGRLPWLSLFAHNFSISMVLSWTKGATTELWRRIDLGQINPNFEDAPYLGDLVLGEHFPEYEALPPTGRQTAIVRFCRLFRRIRLE